MNIKKFAYIMLIFLVLISLSAVSATDSATDDIISADDNEELILDETVPEDVSETNDDETNIDKNNDELVGSENDNSPIYESETGSFRDLDKLINVDWANNETIYLDSDYNFTDEDSGLESGIVISSRNLAIDGNNHTIDANGRARIFRLSTAVVSFKNINFINGKAPGYDGGGAIYSDRDFYFENCNFTNNTAYSGGAIYTNWNCTAINCVFNNNSIYYYSQYDGGAIHSNNATIENCNFTGNTGRYGGALDASGACTIADSNFIDNKCTYEYGGAIYTSNCTVTNSNFTGNQAEIGGAIYSNNYCNVSDCIFMNNNATISTGGGAIWSKIMLLVDNSIFMNNNANGYGGAISTRDCKSNISNCAFVNNSAEKGDAIYVERGETLVSGCSFINNTGNSTLYFDCSEDDDLKINNNIFLNNDNNYMFVLKNKGLLNVDYNWFGNNATNYADKPDDLCNNWLFLNATANPDTISIADKSEIAFNLYLYDPSSEEVSDYDNAPFENINLTVTATNGDVGNTAKLGKSIEFTPSDIGIGTVTASIENADNTIEVNIKPIPEFSIEDKEYDYGETPTISHTLSDGATGTIKYYLNDGTILGESNANEDFTLPVLDAGSYTIIANYSGNDVFTNASATATLTVNKVKSAITVDDVEMNYGETKNLTVATEGATGITAKIDETEASIDGYTISISDLKAGTHTLTVTTVPDENHIAITETATITVNKVESALTVDDVEMNYGESKDLTVATDGATEITAKIDDVEASVDGYTISISGLKAGTHTLTVTTIPDENHTAVTKTATITVNKLKTALSASAVTTTYNVDKNLVITLKDSAGKALNGMKLTVNLGSSKSYTTDKNGQVKINVASLVPKAYTAKISFAGNDIYKASSATAKVTVKKATPKIAAKAKTFKLKTKTKKYKITLKNNKNKVLKNKKVTLKVKGKTYKAKTNSKGVATFKLTKLNKKGKYTAVIKYAGDKYYKKLSKKVKITVKASAKKKSTWKTIARGSKYKTTVKKIQRALKNNGYYLTYKGRYLKIDGIFASCTERSVKQFQKAKGLKVTGKVDEKTAKKLKLI